MKQNVLALSITAALIGLAGSAHAMTGPLGGAAASSTLALNGDGVGNILLVPYFTAQADNSTLINITNTDTINGKAVKVRFRGAANSDDIYDFQVFLSPGDVWTASVSKGSDGRAKLTTADATCTKPAASVLNSTPFVTARLDSTLTTDQKANGTREGYVEIFNMGDIPPAKAGTAVVFDLQGATTAGVDATVANTANPLYTAIKHVNNVAPCSGAAWTYLDNNNLTYDEVTAAATTPRSAGLLPPTTGLFANWTIINVVGAAAWSGEAVAVQSVSAAGAAVRGNVVYWPQTGAAATGVDTYTADPLLRSANVFKYDPTGAAYVADATPAVTAGSYDLPDVSTPYTATAAVNGVTGFVAVTTLVQAANVTASIAATSATNEFLTTSGISASTDWVFSMPTRRYSVAFDYAATISGTDDGRRFTDLGANNFATATLGYFLQGNTLVSSTTNGNGRQVCVKNITPTPWNREESTVTSAAGVVVSPSTPADPLSFCGEATVLSINNGGILAAGTGALKASVAVKDLDVTYREGWMKIATPGGTTTGLPVLGSSFSRAFAGTSSFGTATKHRFAR